MIMRRSLVLFAVLALVGLALVTAGDHHRERRDHRDRDDGERHKDKKDKNKKDKSGCSEAMGDFYRRHVQCRQCVAGIDGKPQKWCATAGATTDKQGKCIDAHATCAAGTTSITSVVRCPSDAPSTKHTCSLCTLDGYAWCQDELASDDEYAGECVALSNRRADAPSEGMDGSHDSDSGASANPSESESGSGGSGASDGAELNAAAAGFMPRTQGEENLSDFSDFRGDDHDDHHDEDHGDEERDHHRRPHHRRRGDDSDDSDASEGNEGSDAAEAAKAAADATAALSTAKCPAGRRAVTKFTSCSSAVSQASSSKRHHGRKWMRRVAFVGVPLFIAVVLAVLLRKRCKRRCAEWRAQRAARRAARAAANGLVIVPGTSLSAVPATRAAAAPAPMAVAYPVQQQQPVAQPLLYSHNMGSSAPPPAMYQPVEGAAVEMHAMPAEASMYPGLAVGGRGYARLGQDAV